jgi:glycerol-3-phosphate O-acyltransferase
MRIPSFIARPLYRFAGRVLSSWTRPAIYPENPTEYITDPDAEVCYVLETGGMADVAALDRVCEKYGLPSPLEPITFCGNTEHGRFIVLRSLEGLLFRRPRKTGSQRLKRLVEAAEHGVAETALLGELGCGRPHEEILHDDRARP